MTLLKWEPFKMVTISSSFGAAAAVFTPSVVEPSALKILSKVVNTHIDLDVKDSEMKQTSDILRHKW